MTIWRGPSADGWLSKKGGEKETGEEWKTNYSKLRCFQNIISFHHVHETFTITAAVLKERLDNGWKNKKRDLQDKQRR